MNQHLQQVRDFHDSLGVAQPDAGDTLRLPNKDIVLRQALLLGCASDTFQAIADGNQPKILAGLVDLAFNALAAIASSGEALVSVPVNWRRDGSMVSVSSALSEKLNQCLSGEAVHYSALYAMCRSVAEGYIQADFDVAFQIVYQHLTSGRGDAEPVNLQAALKA